MINIFANPSASILKGGDLGDGIINTVIAFEDELTHEFIFKNSVTNKKGNRLADIVFVRVEPTEEVYEWCKKMAKNVIVIFGCSTCVKMYSAL